MVRLPCSSATPAPPTFASSWRSAPVVTLATLPHLKSHLRPALLLPSLHFPFPAISFFFLRSLLLPQYIPHLSLLWQRFLPTSLRHNFLLSYETMPQISLPTCFTLRHLSNLRIVSLPTCSCSCRYTATYQLLHWLIAAVLLPYHFHNSPGLSWFPISSACHRCTP